MDKYFPPKYKSNQFHCPWCHVFASQEWCDLYPRNNPTVLHNWYDHAEDIRPADFIAISVCAHCGKASLWANDKLLIPTTSTAPAPHELLPDNVAKLYREAMEVLPVSPRSAAALMRLAVQVLVTHLEMDPFVKTPFFDLLVGDPRSFS